MTEDLWLHICESKVLPKIKTFIWRVITNFIGTQQNLVIRGMLIYPTFPFSVNTDMREHLFY